MAKSIDAERPVVERIISRNGKGPGEGGGSNRTLFIVLGVALALVLLGNLLAWWVQTDGNSISIKDVRFMGSNGKEMSALLYIPPGVTSKTPAPGILAIHGYINSRETQDGFAIEFARRGYVVLALDQTGHGYSDPPAMAAGFGGPDGLRYLRSLDIVDTKNIGLEGHSMGGWAILIAAGTYPDGYKSILIEGSSTGTYGAPEGTPTSPRNLGIVFSKFDEFSNLMWGAKVPKDVGSTPKMEKLFGTTQPIEVGKLYGSIADGTARQLYQPDTTHPQDHISPTAIGYAMNWMQATLTGGKKLADSDQTWYWKEIGNFIALIGMILFLFPAGALLLKTTFFREVRQPLPTWKGLAGYGWWIGAVLTMAVPIVTFFYFQRFSNDQLKPNGFWPQTITNGIMTWAIFNGAITLGLFLLWHFLLNRRAGGTFANYGVWWSNWKVMLSRIGKSALLAVTVMSGAYLLLLLSDWIFKTDFRIWVLAVKLMSWLQFRIFLSYLIPFVVFFLILSMALNGQLRLQDKNDTPPSMWKALLVNVGLLVTGFIVLLLFQYIPLLTGGSLPIDESLLTIVAFQFVPLMAVVALVSTYFFRKTGNIYTGAFLNAILITWIIVAGTATQYAYS